jgi:putative membrane protein
VTWGAWHGRGDVLAGLATSVLLYARGWRALRERGGARASTGPQLWCTLGGWGIVALALLSSLDVYQPLLLSVHMVQHELLLLVAPPLILLGNPLARTLWGLPGPVRAATGSLFSPRSPVRRALATLGRLPVSWGVSTGLLWVWHLPVLYDATEGNGFVHNVEHVTFLAAGLLFWWPLVASPPYGRPVGALAKLGYLIAGLSQRSLLGAALALSHRVYYTHYLLVPRLSGLPALADQRLAGGIMWFGGGAVLLAAALHVIWTGLPGSPEDSRRARPLARAPSPASLSGMARG